MKVRDYSKPAKEYKGRWTEARDALCPCRPCFIAHDCGWIRGDGKRIVSMECAVRYNNGCPRKLRLPHHIFKATKRFQNRRPDQIFKCLRCRRKIEIGQDDFDFHGEPIKDIRNFGEGK
jgi:hypothetical protein